MIKKIFEIRKGEKKKKIQGDGGVNEKTLKQLKKAGANQFVVGSYLQNSKNKKRSYNKLKSIIS